MFSFLKMMKRNRDRGEGIGADGGKLHKIVSTVSISGIFIAAAILVCAMTEIISMNRFVFGIIGTLFIICLALSTSLYWVRKIEQNDFKKTAIVFLSLTLVSALLWVICLWVGVSLYSKLKFNDDATVNDFIGSFNFIKITVMFTVQFLVASFIGMGITKYGKSMYVFQTVAYVSYVFFDFYITYFLACVKLVDSDSVFQISEKISLLGNRIMVTLFVLAVVYILISRVVMKSVENRRMKNMIDDAATKERRGTNTPVALQENDPMPVNSEPVSAAPVATPTEKLANLKAMLNQNLISQEEYDKKKEEILKDM